MIDLLLPVVYIIGLLLLILPAFLQSNSKLKQLLTNFTIWIIVVLIILMAIAANSISKWIKKYKWIAWFGLLAILAVAIQLIYTDIRLFI